MAATLDDALQTILAADYGLNEGDHLTLCDILKKAHGETKKTGKVVKTTATTTLNIKIKFWQGYTYCLDRMIQTDYVQPPGGTTNWIPCDYKVYGFILLGDSSKPMTWNKCVDNVIRIILKLEHSLDRIELERHGIQSAIAYERFIKECARTDLLEKKYRDKFGPLEDGIDESDGAFFRGDYTYNRYIYHIVQTLT